MSSPTIDRFPIEKPANYKFCQFYKVGNDVVEMKRIVAHHFEIPEDDQYYKKFHTEAANQICKWLKTEKGQWIMENAFETPYYDSYKRVDRWSVEFKIIATLTPKQLTEYYLRWS